MSFKGFLRGLVDLVNPLHHIPVVGQIYRKLTGDEINPVVRVTGGALLGGPVGGTLSLADVVLKQATGQDLGETVLALSAKKNPQAETPRLAQGPHRPPSPLPEVIAPSAPDPRWSARDIVWNDATPPPPAPPADLSAVPARMAEGLEKYAALKKDGLAPRFTQNF